MIQTVRVHMSVRMSPRTFAKYAFHVNAHMYKCLHSNKLECPVSRSGHASLAVGCLEVAGTTENRERAMHGSSGPWLVAEAPILVM